MEAFTQTLKIRVSCVPETVRSHYYWAVYVEYRGNDEWVVTDGFEPSTLLARDGSWSYAPGIPDVKMTDEEFEAHRRFNDEWHDQRRYSFEEAMSLAKQEAPKRTVNGFTVQDALTRFSPVNAKEG